MIHLASIFPVGRLTCTGCCFVTGRGCVGLRPASSLFAKFAILIRKDADITRLEFYFHNDVILLPEHFLPGDDSRDVIAILLIVPKTSSGKLVFSGSRPWSSFDNWVGAKGALEVSVRREA